MIIFHRWLLLGVLSFSSLPVSAAEGPGATITAEPGTLVRWTGPGTTRCGMKGRSWPALHGTCYYPVDLQQQPILIAISRTGPGSKEIAHISVVPATYGTESITLPDIPQANPSKADLNRDWRDQTMLSKIWIRKEGPGKFALPLGAPANPLPKGQSFGVKRIFNGKPAPQAHTGTDYATPLGTPVLAVADGTVLVAQDMFFEGNAVFIDHGDGLISMYFHLSEIGVKAGQEVKKGHAVGRVGTTGRATGPHLFFGIRWHDARIDPKFMLEDPSKIPAVTRELR